MRLFRLGVLVWALAQGGQAEDWPMFRGAPTLSGIAQGTLPENPELLWTFNTDEEIKSSIVVVGDKALFGSVDGHVYCLNKMSGKKIWSFKTEAEVEATPLVLKDVVYIGSGDGLMYALNLADGTKRWSYKTEDRILGAANYVIGPDGKARIIFGSYDFFLYCIDAETGEGIWKYESADFINGSPAVDRPLTVVGGCDAIAHMIDLGNGEKVGGVDVGQPIAGSMAIVDGKVYFGHYGEEVVCIDINTKKVEWTYKNRSFAYFSTPAVSKDRVIIGGRDKRLHCINRSDGVKVWEFRTRGAIDASPVICGERVVCGSDDGFLYIVDLKTGEQTWSFEVGEPVQGSAAVSDGRIYIGSLDGSVYCFGRKEGK